MKQKFSTEIQVRPSDFDGNIHVHATKYLEYILMALREQMALCYNYPFERFITEGYTLFLKSLQMSFKAPIVARDTVLAHIWIESVEECEISVGAEITKNDSILALEAALVFSFVSLDSAKKCAIPDHIKLVLNNSSITKLHIPE